MRRTASLAEDYARRHGVARWHDDADAILLADDIDAVYIATHPNTHLEYAVRAAGAGKAVYVEKPMAMSEAECREMQAACDRVGVPLWVAYYRRALRRFEKIRQIVHDGTIGDIRAVESRRLQKVRTEAWQNTPGLSGGGYFFDAACQPSTTSTTRSVRCSTCTAWQPVTLARLPSKTRLPPRTASRAG